MDYGWRWILVVVGILMFAGGVLIIRFRVRFAKWNLRQMRRSALFQSGPLGPGKMTPATSVIMGAGYMVIGAGWVLGVVLK